jgi:hypothetical protein
VSAASALSSSRVRTSMTLLPQCPAESDDTSAPHELQNAAAAPQLNRVVLGQDAWPLLPRFGSLCSTPAAVQEEGLGCGPWPAELVNRDQLVLPMVGKDLRRKPARDDRAASSSGVRDWASKRSQRVTRRDEPRVCSRKGRAHGPAS